MDKLIDFLSTSNNLAIVLSSIVSFVAVIITGIVSIIVSKNQVKHQYKEKSMSLFFEAQLKAYTELYKAAAELERDLKPKETRDIRALIIAAKNAEIVSTEPVAAMIDNFCGTFADFLEKEDSGDFSEEDIKDFKNSLKMMTIYIREELLRFDYYEKKTAKKRKKLQKLYYNVTSNDEND